MRLGIAKEKHSKTIRWIFYIGIPIMLLISYPFLNMLNLNMALKWSLFAIVCIAGYVVVHKVVDNLIFYGEVEITDNSFLFKMNDQETEIPFNEIKMMLLQPMLGLSRVPDTFKLYKCQIRTSEKSYTYQITREELKNGKLVVKNLANPTAFDLIKFLKKKNISFKYGKRIN